MQGAGRVSAEWKQRFSKVTDWFLRVEKGYGRVNSTEERAWSLDLHRDRETRDAAEVRKVAARFRPPSRGRSGPHSQTSFYADRRKCTSSYKLCFVRRDRVPLTFRRIRLAALTAYFSRLHRHAWAVGDRAARQLTPNRAPSVRLRRDRGNGQAREGRWCELPRKRFLRRRRQTPRGSAETG